MGVVYDLWNGVANYVLDKIMSYGVNNLAKKPNNVIVFHKWSSEPEKCVGSDSLEGKILKFPDVKNRLDKGYGS